ncbi:MAG: ABC transporter permease [Polyangiaceae bacterium]|nr:ABC transporter permease [Polyangiaceae bacterium]
MLALLVRRLLWLIPTLFVVSLLTFLLFSFLPERPEEHAAHADLDPEIEAQLERERFGDLPRFVNLEPEDVETRAARAARLVAEGGPDAVRGARELARLGGAALPYVIPSLDGFDPTRRERVALALLPVAIRMGLPNRQDASVPDRAADFWARFWADRSVEFRQATVRTAVERLARYQTPSRAAELAQLDTFALPALMERLQPPHDAASLEVARTLTDALCQATDRSDRIEDHADLAEARLVVARWRQYWLVHESDYVAYDGAGRAAAALRETRYGKWAAQVVLSLTIRDDATSRSLERLRRAIPITLSLIFGGIALAYIVGTSLGVASSVSERRLPKVILGSAVVTLHALPSATVAVVCLWLAPSSSNIGLGILVVGLGMLASPARHQRDALSSVFVREFVRASRARGASFPRAFVAQGLRQSLLATISVASVEPPAALGAAFMVEQVLGLPGLGQLTVLAVAERDVTFLMGLVLGAVLIAALMLLLSDVVQATVDPRLRGRLGSAVR